MTEQDKNQLLEAILGDDELAQVRQATLSRGLREMRRRRQRTAVARACMMAFPALLLAAMVLHHPRTRTPLQASAPMALSLAPQAASKVEYITADQLFALFPNRSMALVGKPGHQQLIFLDKPAGNNL